MSALADAETLLRVIADAARRKVPLPPALREAGAAGMAVAARLEAGASLPEALTGVVPPSAAAALAGPLPPLEAAALLSAEQLAAQRTGRARWFEQLAHPILTLVLVVPAALYGAHLAGLAPDPSWLLAALAVAGLAALLAVAAALPTRGAIAVHAVQAGRWERAALAARWRLTEAELVPWLGADLGGIAAVLGRPDAEEHCRRLAEWHREAAVAIQERIARLLTVLVLVAAAAVMIAAAAPALAALPGV